MGVDFLGCLSVQSVWYDSLSFPQWMLLEPNRYHRFSRNCPTYFLCHFTSLLPEPGTVLLCPHEWLARPRWHRSASHLIQHFTVFVLKCKSLVLWRAKYSPKPMTVITALDSVKHCNDTNDSCALTTLMINVL